MKEHVIKYKTLYLFILISYAISWGSLLFGNTEYSFFWFLAKFGFTISAIIVILILKDNQRKTNIIEYLMNFKLKYIMIGLSPLLAYLISILIIVPTAELELVKDQSFLNWVYVLLISPASGILFYSLFRGGLGEEIGLRGLIVPYLVERQSLIKTALIIGVFWALWHYPVWIPSGIVNLVAGTLATIAWSFIFTLLFVKTKSLGLVILLHATGNAADDIFEWMFPKIVNYDWEIIYILLIILFGIISLISLGKMKNSFQLKND